MQRLIDSTLISHVDQWRKSVVKSEGDTKLKCQAPPALPIEVGIGGSTPGKFFDIPDCRTLVLVRF